MATTGFMRSQIVNQSLKIWRASWSVHIYDTTRTKQDVTFGRYQYELRAVDGALRIARKKIILAADRIATMLDFYSV